MSIASHSLSLAFGFDFADLYARDCLVRLDNPPTELTYARFVDSWLQAEADHKPQLELAAKYAAWATHTPAGQQKHRRGVLFQVVHKIDPYHLVPVESLTENGVTKLQLH